MTATFSLPRIRCHSVKLLPGARKKNIWRQKNRCGCTVWRDLFAECHTRQSSRVRQGSHITLTNPKLGTSRKHISGSIVSVSKGVRVGHLGKQKPMSSCTRWYLVKRWDIYNHLHRLCYFCTLTHSDTHTRGVPAGSKRVRRQHCYIGARRVLWPCPSTDGVYPWRC